MTQYKITFAPSFKEVACKEGKTILEAAREAGVYLDSYCAGKGKCGKCRVRIIDGTVSPVTNNESELVRTTDREQGYRLACMTKIFGDVTVLIPGETVFKVESGKKVFAGRSRTVHPAVKSYPVNLTKEKTARDGYFEKITGFLASQYGLRNLSADISVIRKFSGVIKDDENTITAFVHMGKEIIDVRPGLDERVFGIALDVGTTTLAFYLCDLRNGNVIATASITNPQVLSARTSCPESVIPLTIQSRASKRCRRN